MSSDYLAIFSQKKQRCIYFVYECFDSGIRCALVFSGMSDLDCSQVLDVPPVVYSSCWAMTWMRLFVVAFEAVRGRQKRVCFRSSGGRWCGGKLGKQINLPLGRFCGIIPPPPPPACSQKWGSVCPLLCRGSVAQERARNKKGGVHARHGPRGSRQRVEIIYLRQVWARGSACRGRIFPGYILPPNGGKIIGYTLPLTISCL